VHTLDLDGLQGQRCTSNETGAGAEDGDLIAAVVVVVGERERERERGREGER